MNITYTDHWILSTLKKYHHSVLLKWFLKTRSKIYVYEDVTSICFFIYNLSVI